MSSASATARPRLLPLRQLGQLSMSPPSDYGWVESLVWQPIAYSELHLCAHYYPLAIRLVRGEPLLGAVLSRAYLIRPLVDGQGAWQSGYVPMSIRSFPFQAMGTSPDPLDDLIVPPESPFFSPHGTISFVEASGKPSPFIEGIHALCRRLNDSRRNLSGALDQLLIAGVLVPIAQEDGEPPSPDASLLTVDRDKIAELAASSLAAMARHRFSTIDVLIACLFSQAHFRQGCLPRREALPAPERQAELGLGRGYNLMPLPDVAVDDGELLSFADLEAALASLHHGEADTDGRDLTARAFQGRLGSTADRPDR